MTCSPRWTRQPEDMTVAGGRRMTLGHTLIKRVRLVGATVARFGRRRRAMRLRVESFEIYKVCPEVTGHDWA
jgi:hypothetical protein